MYSIEQLQALDYLLKRITNEKPNALFGKNLKLVVEINNSFWYGDFIQLDGNLAFQLCIEDDGDISRVSYSPYGNNSPTLLHKIWETYSKETTNNHFFSNPFKKMDDLPLLFNSLCRLITLAEITAEDSKPFHPYLYNAKSIDRDLSLPFINLADEKIKLISIVEAD